jgi:hypothetical protein
MWAGQNHTSPQWIKESLDVVSGSFSKVSKVKTPVEASPQR